MEGHLEVGKDPRVTLDETFGILMICPVSDFVGARRTLSRDEADLIVILPDEIEE